MLLCYARLSIYWLDRLMFETGASQGGQPSSVRHVVKSHEWERRESQWINRRLVLRCHVLLLLLLLLLLVAAFIMGLRCVIRSNGFALPAHPGGTGLFVCAQARDRQPGRKNMTSGRGV